MNIKGLIHIEVLTSPSCLHCLAAIKMVRKIDNWPSYIIVTGTSVGTLEGYNKAKSQQSTGVWTIHINHRLPFVDIPSSAYALKLIVINAAQA